MSDLVICSHSTKGKPPLIAFQQSSAFDLTLQQLLQQIDEEYTVDLPWLEQLWNHENMFKTGSC